MTITTTLGLTTAQALTLLTDPEIRDRWRQVSPDATVIGYGDPGARRLLDPGVLASALGDESSPPVFLSGDTGVDLVYNLARQVLSADQLSAGRSGLFLTATDPESDVDTYTTTLIRLWQSWPLDSVVADRTTGILVESDRIRAIDHGGVAGPLSVPSSQQGRPVLVRQVDTGQELSDGPGDADLLLISSGEYGFVGHLAVPVPWLAVLGTDQGKAPSSVAAAVSAGAAGVHFHSPDAATPSVLNELLDAVDSVHQDQPDGAGRTARDLLGLPVPVADPEDGVEVFPRPQPATAQTTV